jgi:DUF2075 family protein/putative NADH-flavin reductase
MSQHKKNEERKELTKVEMIYDEKMNKSASLDIESSLIKYVSGDGLYKLQNVSAGLLNHNYYQRNIYTELFKEIWVELKKRKLVKSDLFQIENTDLFKYSPYKSLTTDQYIAVDNILQNIADHAKSLTTNLIRGSAGTGKTVLAVFLVKLLATYNSSTPMFDDEFEEVFSKNIEAVQMMTSPNKLKIGFVVPMTPLRQTLRKVFRNIKGLSAKMIIGPSDVAKADYDILIVDEAHRLHQRRNITNYASFDSTNKKLDLSKHSTELEWIFKTAKHVILFYDNDQSIRPSDVRADRFDELSKDNNRSFFTLELASQMRVKAGSDYIKFVKEILRGGQNIKKPELGDYDLQLFDDVDLMVKSIKALENEFGLCRVVAGYAWPWISKGMTYSDAITTSTYDIEIGTNRYIWNTKREDWVNSATSINEIGCIHTIQGYDLNYCGVILGPEIKYDPTKKTIIIDTREYHDQNGYFGANDDEVKEYIINIYSTLLSRGIRGTYLYVCDKQLREYIRRNLS